MSAAARGGAGPGTAPRPADDERGSHLADPRLADAMLAARLLAAAPGVLGGICLRGGGPARDLVIEALRGALPSGIPWRRLPGHIDDDRLCGGIDLAASLVAGLPVAQPGLLAEIAGGELGKQLLAASLVGATVWISYSTVRRHVGSSLMALSVAFLGAITLVSMPCRPHLFTFVGLALTAHCLDGFSCTRRISLIRLRGLSARIWRFFG